jgi:hypothetical protein
MGLPINIQPDYILLYGTPSLQNIAPVDIKEYQFGTVIQTYGNSPIAVNLGQSVFFKIKDSVPVVFSASIYNVLPSNKIIFIEDNPVAP